jgi:hypothetical protein
VDLGSDYWGEEVVVVCRCPSAPESHAEPPADKGSACSYERGECQRDMPFARCELAVWGLASDQIRNPASTREDMASAVRWRAVAG